MTRGSIIVWRVWEFTFKVFAGVKPMSTHRDLFLVADRRYLGRPFTIEGVQVRRFDRVLEIHINNDFVMEVLRNHHTIMASSVKLLKEARRSLPVLADYVQNETNDTVSVLYGVTFINRGIERLGFSTFPIRNRFFGELSRRHLRKLFQMVNPAADELLEQHAESYVPKVVAITKNTLLSLYGSQDAQ
jgi:hypothetical protein